MSTKVCSTGILRLANLYGAVALECDGAIFLFVRGTGFLGKVEKIYTDHGYQVVTDKMEAICLNPTILKRDNVKYVCVGPGRVLNTEMHCVYPCAEAWKAEVICDATLSKCEMPVIPIDYTKYVKSIEEYPDFVKTMESKSSRRGPKESKVVDVQPPKLDGMKVRLADGIVRPVKGGLRQKEPKPKASDVDGIYEYASIHPLNFRVPAGVEAVRTPHITIHWGTPAGKRKEVEDLIVSSIKDLSPVFKVTGSEPSFDGTCLILHLAPASPEWATLLATLERTPELTIGNPYHVGDDAVDDERWGKRSLHTTLCKGEASVIAKMDVSHLHGRVIRALSVYQKVPFDNGDSLISEIHSFPRVSEKKSDDQKKKVSKKLKDRNSRKSVVKSASAPDRVKSPTLQNEDAERSVNKSMTLLDD